MADNSDTTQSCVESEFRQARMLNCFFHVKECVRKNHKAKFRSTEDYEEFMALLTKVSDASMNSEGLHKLLLRLLKRWLKKKRVSSDYAETWDDEYGLRNFERKAGWTMSAGAPGIPRTNNAMEGSFTQVKDVGTNRHIMGLKSCIESFLDHYSTPIMNDREFEVSPVVETPQKGKRELWKEAQELAKEVNYFARDEKQDLKISGVGYIVVLSHTFYKELLDEHGDAACESFLAASTSKKEVYKRVLVHGASSLAGLLIDDVLGILSSCVHLSSHDDLGVHWWCDFVRFECSCVDYWKNNCCVHSAALGVFTGEVTVPASMISATYKHRARNRNSVGSIINGTGYRGTRVRTAKPIHISGNRRKKKTKSTAATKSGAKEATSAAGGKKRRRKKIASEGVASPGACSS
jgi:hypothetical protein